MTKNEAFAIAKQNCTAYRLADVEHMFGRAHKPRGQDYGTQNGSWFCVGEFNFSLDELSGFSGDPVQQAFAYL